MTKTIDRIVAGQVSAGQADFCYALPPGEAFKFPSVLVVEWAGDSPQIGTNVRGYTLPTSSVRRALAAVA